MPCDSLFGERIKLKWSLVLHANLSKNITFVYKRCLTAILNGNIITEAILTTTTTMHYIVITITIRKIEELKKKKKKIQENNKK